MHIRLLSSAGIALSLAALWWYASPPNPAVLTPKSNVSASEEAAYTTVTSNGPALRAGPAKVGTSAEPSAEELLEHPRVQSWLALEENKRLLTNYFADAENSALNDGEAWALIEQAEREGRVIGFEAMHMKIAWLERNSANAEEFNRRRDELIADYRQRAEKMNRDYDPASIPGFTDYKAREADIIREVRAMETIPDGLSEQAYLRQRLLEARIEAFESRSPGSESQQ